MHRINEWFAFLIDQFTKHTIQVLLLFPMRTFIGHNFNIEYHKFKLFQIFMIGYHIHFPCCSFLYCVNLFAWRAIDAVAKNEKRIVCIAPIKLFTLTHNRGKHDSFCLFVNVLTYIMGLNLKPVTLVITIRLF